LALADSVRSGRYNDKEIVQGSEVNVGKKGVFEPRPWKGKQPMRPMRNAEIRPDNLQPLRVPEEILVASHPEIVKPVKAAWAPVNIFSPEYRAKGPRQKMPQSVRKERIADNNKQVAELEANNKVIDIEIAAAEARQKELEQASAQAHKDKAATSDPVSAAKASERIEMVEIELVVEQSIQQAGQQKVVNNLKKEEELKEDKLDLEMEAAADRVEEGPGGWHKEWDEKPSDADMASPDNAVLKEALEPVEAAAVELVEVHEWIEVREGTIEQMYYDRLARSGLPPPTSGFIAIGESTAGSDHQGEQHQDDPYNSDLDHVPEPGEVRNAIEKSPVKTAQDLAKEAMLKHAEFAQKRPHGRFRDPLRNRPAQPKPNEGVDDRPWDYYEGINGDRNPLTAAAQDRLDKATAFDAQIYSDDWAKQCREPGFWRTWDKNFDLDLAAKHWQDKGECSLAFLNIEIY
jgi:hypothetical protein